MLLRKLRGIMGRDERGLAAMEFALLLPFLMLVLLGTIDFGRFAYAAISVANGARAAAAACVYSTASPCGPFDTTPPYNPGSIQQHVINEMTHLNSSLITITANDTAPGTDPGCPCVTVTVAYAFSTLIPWPGIPGGTSSVPIASTARIVKNIEAP